MEENKRKKKKTEKMIHFELSTLFFSQIGISQKP
jgi:hypothetical protein